MHANYAPLFALWALGRFALHLVRLKLKKLQKSSKNSWHLFNNAIIIYSLAIWITVVIFFFVIIIVDVN